MSRTLELAVAVAMAAGASVAFSLPCRASPVPDTVAVDSVFARYATDTGPGCVIGISQAGRTLLTRAYGMANLENDVPNTVGTIFEAGSISKQFTAAATLLLVARGRLALDSDIRSWFPELPDYGDTIAVYHLLHHTSGLRDWGVVSGIGGWPRSSRTVSNAHVLAIIARQRALNHPVGAQYSYSNSNYNLLVLLVERITGEPFAEFTRRELFAPLGMIHTEWRDDYARLVSQRAQAYAPDGRTWRLDMPFENAYGHGGLLTTVADLLRWNDALTAHRVGDPDVSRLLVAPGRLRDGTPIDYACGIVVRVEREVQEIFHGGATAGYRGFLARYPAQDASVAVLCNAADADPTALGQGAVAGMVPFGPPAPPAPAPPEGPAAPFGLDPKTVPDFLGTWQSEEAEASYRIRSRGDTLQVVRWPGDGAMLRPTGPDRFAVGPMELRFERDTAHRVVRLLVSVPRALNVEFVRVSGP